MEVDPLIALLTTLPFLVTVFGLHALIWKPTLALLAERETNIDGFLAEAEQLQAEVVTRQAELDAKLAEARARATVERNRLRGQAQDAERALVDEARKVAEARLVEARAGIEAQRQTAQAELHAGVGALSVGIASAVLGRSVEADLMTRRTLSFVVLAGVLLVPTAALAAGGGDGSFHPGRFGRHLLNLVIFVGAIVYFARTPISDFLAFRRSEIKDGLDKAWNAKQSTEAEHAALQERLDGLAAEIERMMATVASEGQREHERLVVSGQEAALQVEASTGRAIDEETRRAATELRQEAIDLALGKATELLVQAVGSADHKRLAEGYLATLQENARS